MYLSLAKTNPWAGWPMPPSIRCWNARVPIADLVLREPASRSLHAFPLRRAYTPARHQAGNLNRRPTSTRK